MRVIQAFTDAGITSQSSSGWLRIKADWRGGDGYSVAVHPDTGGWKDHTTGETGNWKTLAVRLGLDGNALSPLTQEERQSIAQKADEDLRKRTQAAQALWSKAQPVGKALDNQVELHGLTTTGKMAKRNAEKWVESYLDERNGKEAAIAAGARWASLPKELNGKPEPCILWPMRDFSTGELTGIQREWGRGHENKRMLGRHMTDTGESSGFILRGTGNTIYLCEGMQTAAAVWAATGQTTLCLYDTAGLRNPPITALQKGLGEIADVIVAGDRDVSGAGGEAANICADKMSSIGIRAQVSLPPQDGTVLTHDWADLLSEHGREATKEFIELGLHNYNKVEDTMSKDISKKAVSVKESDEKRDLRSELTQKMATLMEAGEIPWEKPWKDAQGPIALGAAHNPVSGTTYSGGNRFILTMTAFENQYTSNEWCTFKQAQSRATAQEGAEKDTNVLSHWSVKKGEKATYIERWQETPFYNRKSLGLEIKANGKPCSISEEVNGGLKLKDGQVVPKSAISVVSKDGKEMSFAQAAYDYNLRFAKPFAVFNLDQMDNVPGREPRVPLTEIGMHDRVQSIVKGMQADGLKLETGGDRAYYQPSADRIQMPKPEQFNSLPHYYSTLLHEIGHSTGAPDRLNRDGIAGLDSGFGSEKYAKEELVAELASFFVAAETGIPRQSDPEHAAYLQSWAKVLREDQNALFKAAKEAGQAVDYILSKEKALEIAKDRPVSEPNLDHGRTDGKVLGVDAQTDQLVQSTYGDKMAVVHSLSVAPEAKTGDNLSIRYNKGVSKTVDMDKEQAKKREMAKDEGFGLERSFKK
ncbi:zincin-like metallopeptidase domain-containing protein [Acidithiobacillus ferriphilus]|uniref:zincin-like metallopeptidase domain-containing protein n=1 Tax=Acidithiobacillus ferriphilus TaxID=1689834 RepID=UPI001C07C321|nr:zincin-like metallopeptidase domain-containing protein [Acidithiobacillus ferriphilus]MBU2853470.1 DUF1738 domain-containing protein [Acidithiobacillus ferriphilus]